MTRFMCAFAAALLLTPACHERNEATGGIVGPTPHQPVNPVEREPVRDFDGNSYRTVQIGGQVWMAESLRSRHYADGAPLESVVRDGDEANAVVYGRLYRAAEARRNAPQTASVPSGVQGACPSGWHLPSEPEWQVLVDALGGSSVAGGKLKETGTEHWDPPNSGATNESLFTARAAGLLGMPFLQFEGGGRRVYFRSTGDMSLMLDTAWISSRMGGIHPEDSASVRCLRDR